MTALWFGRLGDPARLALWYYDIPALGIPGATSWKEAWAEYLEGVQTIYVVVEPDDGGKAVCRWISKSPIRDRVRLVNLGKDVSELHLSSPEKFVENWNAALEKTTLSINIFPPSLRVSGSLQ